MGTLNSNSLGIYDGVTMGSRPQAPSKPLVRPWALATPILVLLAALPLLRPLRHPGADGVSDDEAGRLATVAALVQHHSLSLEGLDLGPGVPLPNDGLVRSNGRVFSNQPPVMAVLLAGPYWLLTKFGLTLRSSPVLAPYLLTLIGVTLPVAVAAGLIYKMGRVFDLRRRRRCLLAVGVVFGSGLISYAVVLNPHALAAALVLGAVAAMIYVANSQRPRRSIWWLIVAGACAGLAMVLDPPAAVFPLPLLLVIWVMRWPRVRRCAGMGLFVLGVVPPIYLHLALNLPITGDWKPAIVHPELALTRCGDRAVLASWGTVGADLAPVASTVSPDDDDPPITRWGLIQRDSINLAGALVGRHGLLSHFPVVILGLFGIGAVFHRNWPATTKMLAVVSASGAASVILLYALSTADSHGAMFANQWFIVLSPLILFWAGAWLRRDHRVRSWTAASVLLIFSVAVSLVGATDPLPRSGYDHYTAATAARHLLSPAVPDINKGIALNAEELTGG